MDMWSRHFGGKPILGKAKKTRMKQKSTWGRITPTFIISNTQRSSRCDAHLCPECLTLSINPGQACPLCSATHNKPNCYLNTKGVILIQFALFWKPHFDKLKGFKKYGDWLRKAAGATPRYAENVWQTINWTRVKHAHVCPATHNET